MGVSPYVRTVKTASGATAVQVVWSNRLGSKRMDHIGSAHTPEDVEILKAVAQWSPIEWCSQMVAVSLVT